MIGPKLADLEKATWEQQVYKGNQIIETIKLQADFFEMRTRVKPTIFMSYDLFALVAAAAKDLLVYKVDKTQTGHTICGYDLEITHQSKESLYIGYKVVLQIVSKHYNSLILSLLEILEVLL